MTRWLATGLLLSGCAEPPEALPCPSGGAGLVAVLSDFQVGRLAEISPEGGIAAFGSVAQDSVVAAIAGGPLVLSRSEASAVRAYDWACPLGLAEYPLAVGANPHALAVVDDRWYVSEYETDALQILSAGGAAIGTVPLAEFADSDGLPEADGLALVGGRLFVALQQLDRAAGWTPAGGLVAEVDPATDAVSGAWSVGPSPKIYPHGAGLVVLTGVYFALDGAISVFDPGTGETTPLATEAALGKDFQDYAELDGHGVFVGVDPELGTRSTLWCVDWATATVVEGPSYDSWIADLAAGDGRIWVAARTGLVAGAPSGVFAVDPVSCVEESSPWIAASPEAYSLAWIDP